MRETELRHAVGADAGLRQVKSAGIAGYAARYGVKSNPLPLPNGRGSFIEIISPGTFARALATKPDVRGLLEHDPAKMFARTTSGTMTLRDDHRGLYFEVPKLPKHGVGPRILEAVESGDLDACSFRFGVNAAGDTWTTERVGGAEVVLHTLKDIRLVDVSLTAFPAYPQTEVSLRSLDAWAREQRRNGKSIQKVILDMLCGMAEPKRRK